MVGRKWATMSDKELRQELLSRGFPNMPVTETTRSIIIKKLQSTEKKSCKQRKQPSDDVNSFREISNDDISATNIENNLKDISMHTHQASRDHFGYSVNREPYSKSFQKMYSPPPIVFCSTDSPSIYRGNEDFIKINKKQANLNCLTQANQSHHGVVNRLLSFREKAFSKEKPLNNGYNKQLPFHATKDYNKDAGKYRRKFINIIKYVGAQTTFNQSFIPYVLVGAFLVFFLFLAIMYAFRSPDIFEINERSSNMPICTDLTKTTACIHPERLVDTISIINILLKILKDRANQHHCSKSNYIGISQPELFEYIHQHSLTYSREKLDQDLASAAVLINNNPQWIISVEKVNPLSHSSTYKETVLNFVIKSHGSLMCAVYKKIQKCFLIIGIGSIIAAILSLIYISYRYIKAWRLNRSNIVEQFTTDIVNELIYRASLNEAPEEREVIINHLRDKLIPLNRRNTFLKYWNDALRILENNDSRIQFGVSLCNGEEYRTIKWIGNGQSKICHAGSVKKWQSPAFDSSNKILNPPTPCLKIRHMFDHAEANHPDLKQIIQAAILEKVGSRCRIHDIQIDKQSCCVYVRCANEIDAGIIHNEINGWWFDKRLISIKFLRLQRYFTRFPDTLVTKQK